MNTQYKISTGQEYNKFKFKMRLSGKIHIDKRFDHDYRQNNIIVL